MTAAAAGGARPALFDPDRLVFDVSSIQLSGIAPLLNGDAAACDAPRVSRAGEVWIVRWPVLRGIGTAFVLRIEPLGDPASLRLDLTLEGAPAGTTIDSLGLRFGRCDNVLRYLRNGYTSWDGSYFVEIDSARTLSDVDPRTLNGYAVTALVGENTDTAVIGFLRHDQYQSRLQFTFPQGPLSLDIETLIDRVPSGGDIHLEPLILLSGCPVENTLRRWAQHVADASSTQPRLRAQRISGWCSWYNLYSSISEPVLLDHLHAAARFRDRYQVPFEVFQIDDGFTPEMGDWLDVKPAFPRGMAPLLAEIRAAGFIPGLWIAPFMVGNRSRLYAEHPDWVVRERGSLKPITPMKFYGEFRWHKRSEEYYCLDITHPDAERYIRSVFRTWTKDWGCRYFKTDFMFFGAEYGPAQAQWHGEGLSRIAIWMRMACLIREEIGDALWLTCGGPIWAPVGLVDAVRIGRDIGVSWKGHYSAESLLRDQTARNFANGVLWQSDPDCILLRDRFHDLTDDEVHSLAVFAGLTGGVLMTSDQLDEIPEARRALFADLARDSAARSCDFPLLGAQPVRHRVGLTPTGAPALLSEGDPVILQRFTRPDGSTHLNVFNTGDSAEKRIIPDTAEACVSIGPHSACALALPSERTSQ